jgi:hypothetical protein
VSYADLRSAMVAVPVTAAIARAFDFSLGLRTAR